jgi:hypothetical protein
MKHSEQNRATEIKSKCNCPLTAFCDVAPLIWWVYAVPPTMIGKMLDIFADSLIVVVIIVIVIIVIGAAPVTDTVVVEFFRVIVAELHVKEAFSLIDAIALLVESDNHTNNSLFGGLVESL